MFPRETLCKKKNKKKHLNSFGSLIHSLKLLDIQREREALIPARFLFTGTVAFSMPSLAGAAARKNVFLDACALLQRIFRFKIKLKPAELSEHLGQIRADAVPAATFISLYCSCCAASGQPATTGSLPGSHSSPSRSFPGRVYV